MKLHVLTATAPITVEVADGYRIPDLAGASWLLVTGTDGTELSLPVEKIEALWTVADGASNPSS